jgi:ferric-dicitrate binding protein FerR (iron transport regulator)
MDEKPSKLSRALGAMRGDVWTELQHRRVGDRIDRAVSLPVRRASRGLSLALAAALGGLCVVVATLAIRKPPVVTEGSTVGNGGDSTSAALSDGSQVEVERGGQVRVVKDRLDETRVEVLAGHVDFEVTSARAGRSSLGSGASRSVWWALGFRPSSTSRGPQASYTCACVAEWSKFGGAPVTRLLA